MTIRSKPASKEYRDGWDKIFIAHALRCKLCDGAGGACGSFQEGEQLYWIKCFDCNGTGKQTKT